MKPKISFSYRGIQVETDLGDGFVFEGLQGRLDSIADLIRPQKTVMPSGPPSAAQQALLDWLEGQPVRSVNYIKKHYPANIPSRTQKVINHLLAKDLIHLAPAEYETMHGHTRSMTGVYLGPAPREEQLK